MRIRCEVQIVNRLMPNARLGKPTFTHISLGRKPGDKDGPIFLMLCTFKNRNGEKFKLRKNVEGIFSKFVSDGKATLRLTEPPKDIVFSKADPSQLNIFLKIVKLTCEGKECPAKALSTLAPVSSKQVEKPVTTLIISKPSEYPMTLPKSLEKLTINECLLRRVSPQIVSMTNLKELDLGYNQLTSLPDSFSELTSLTSLALPFNKLVAFPSVMFSGQLPKTLRALDMRHNEIIGLPADIVKLKAMITMNMSNNQLKVVPESLGMMASLRNIHMSDNHLDFLPGSFLLNTFETVDFSNNPFRGELPHNVIRDSSFGFPSLLECAAKVIIVNRIHYTVEDLDFHSINYLKTAHRCLCGAVCFGSGKGCVIYKIIPSTTSYRSGLIPFLVYYCSQRCLEIHK